MNKCKSIFIKNIYYMLSYAFKTLRRSDYDKIATEKFDNIHNLFAAILAKGIGQQLKQGLHKEYISHNEDLTIMRGKINISQTIKNKVIKKRILSCDNDFLSENNILNQILKTTITRLILHEEVDVRYKDNLKKNMLFFCEVDMIDPTTIKWPSIHFKRNNNNYRMLISLCKLILEGMLMSTDKGEYEILSFTDGQHMCRLYEKFILEYYKKEFPMLKANASQIPWALDDGVSTMLPIMHSDISLSYGSQVLIIDAKYYTHTTQKQFNKHTLHSNNLYQIFTYVKNKAMEFGSAPHVVSGILLYAKTNEEIQPDNSYMMSGNKISVKTLNLNSKFEEISAQLDEIVVSHFGEIVKNNKVLSFRKQ